MFHRLAWIPGRAAYMFPGPALSTQRSGMQFIPPWRRLAALAAILVLNPAPAPAAALVDFNRQVRPILAENCFRCHGFDEKARKAKLRLDLRDAALQPAKSGAAPIVPRRPEESELIKRVTTADADDLMPPPDSGKKLTAAQKDILRDWIASGANYARHWSFELPKAESPLPVKSTEWPRNEIDRFVLAKLEAEGLKPSPEAAPETLLRRVTLDLTGLPPTLEELDQFRSEISQQSAIDTAYSRAVDRLLQSPHFGERMAVDWLDAARYADTNGYFGDKTRQMWPWRDWVINAFNRNLPFDQFTIEQLAGDLLPNATLDQRIATGFNRNHMANNESGIIDEEYRVEYIVDQIDATATTWLGLTLGCAQCHDHKYDPITQKDFYQVFAFFNNTPETGHITKDDPAPVMEVPTPGLQAELARLDEAKRRALADWTRLGAAVTQRLRDWEKSADATLPSPPCDALAARYDFDERLANAASDRFPAQNLGTPIHFEDGLRGMSAKFDATQHLEVEARDLFDADAPWTIGLWLKGEGALGCVLSKIEPMGNRRGLEMIWQKGRLQVNLVNRWGVSAIETVTVTPISGKTWHQVVLGYDGKRKASGLQLFIDGKAAAVSVNRDSLDGSLSNREPLRIGRRDSGLGFYGELDELRILRRAVSAGEVDAWFWGDRLRGIIMQPEKKRSATDAELLLGYFTRQHGDATERESHERMVAARNAERDLRGTIPTTLVMQENKEPRATHVLTRGQYDKPGDMVKPNAPAAIAPWPANATPNRLGFAQWLVSPANPLTARVAVNRLWSQCFGEGLVRTVNDFGTQGDSPTHPELLDWLAVRFVKGGWDVKDMLRFIVTSAAYRQSSAATRDLLQRDPENRLLAHGPRFRLSAEALRDQALSTAGLLSPKIGGPSVKPFQPPGLWEAVSYNGEETYETDHGDGLWRRSLYTFWKRQAPPPGIQVFDGPTREKCVVRRARTNTPLQALTLLNDDTYVEAAKSLANLALTAPAPSSGSGDDATLALVFRRATSRMPDAAELAALRSLLARQRTRFQKDHDAAAQLLAVGEFKHDQKLDPAELAAWTVVAQTVMNLDEVITRR